MRGVCLLEFLCPCSIVRRQWNLSLGPFKPGTVPSGFSVVEKSVFTLGILQPPVNRYSPEFSNRFRGVPPVLTGDRYSSSNELPYRLIRS